MDFHPIPGCIHRTVNFPPYTEFMAEIPESKEPQATHEGPSWGLMLFFILLAMLAAIGIAWAFVTPLLHRH
jgi:hypothetical protein